MAKKKKRRRARGDPAPPKKPPKDEQKETGKLARVVILLTALLLVATAIVFFLHYPEVRGPGPGIPQRMTFTGKEPASAIVDRLVSEGMVRDRKVFALWFRMHGGWVAKGHHLLPDDLTPRELVLRLQRSGTPAKVTFPEGFTRFEMGKRLEKLEVCDLRAFLDATTNKTILAELGIEAESAEGFLFPATYDFSKDSDPDEVVRTLVKQLDRRFSQIAAEHPKGLRDLKDGMGWSKAQILALASMIEKEAVVDEERPLIASVFLNRLRDPAFSPKFLQCDPTAAYGCLVSDAPSCMSFTSGSKITHDMLQDAKNPYNTYKHEGLPPGPIGNPGAKSIEASLDPSPSHHLYFVAKGGGRHTFSETYAEHQAAIKNAP